MAGATTQAAKPLDRPAEPASCWAFLKHGSRPLRAGGVAGAIRVLSTSSKGRTPSFLRPPRTRGQPRGRRVINDTGRGGHQSDLRRVACNPNYWYPLAEVRQVGRNKTLGVSFGGDAIALARTETGKVFALEDRCAHRQFPLSKGVVCAGGELQCGYHSWRYNDEGQITRIPQCAPGAKPNRGVRAYPSREAYGLIFVFPGDRALAPHTPLPELPLFDSGDYRRMFFSRQVNCHYSFMHENLMDMNHQFLHRRLMGSV